MPHILIIDDSADTLEFLSMGLQDKGHHVFMAEDGDAGLRIQRATPAELLITDIFMPNKDGMETIAAFRREFPEVRIIAVSGSDTFSRTDYLKAASQIGAHASLRKPYELEDMYRTIDEVLYKAP